MWTYHSTLLSVSRSINKVPKPQYTAKKKVFNVEFVFEPEWPFSKNLLNVNQSCFLPHNSWFLICQREREFRLSLNVMYTLVPSYVLIFLPGSTSLWWNYRESILKSRLNWSVCVFILHLHFSYKKTIKLPWILNWYLCLCS